MRLDQFLVKSNICSRSEAKKYVKSGRVSVDGQIAKDSSAHIDENAAIVKLDGVPIEYEEYHYFMLNKPAGCVSATRDGLSDTVIDILSAENTKDLFPVGRLDKDTEGLLLITDDGKLAHDLLSPKKHVDKTYYVEADRKLSKEDMRIMEEGMDIGDEDITLPASIRELSQTAISECDFDLTGNLVASGDNLDDAGSNARQARFVYELTIHEGRFHQVKRMFEKCGSNVIYLKRLSMGTLKLDESLDKGQYRKLTKDEVASLKESRENQK